MDQAIPENVSLDDVWQWLNRGWFWLRTLEGEWPAQLSREEDWLVCAINGSEYPFKREECFPHWPQCGAINMQGYAVIVERLQVRQYRRTYNDRCVSLNIPRKWDVMKRHPNVKGLNADNPELVNALFNPLYYTYTRALGLLEGGWVSVAINPHLIVAGTVEEHMIYYRNKLTARVVNGQLVPLNPGDMRNRRILKWFDGRLSSENLRDSR
jgi:hypothetical protein